MIVMTDEHADLLVEKCDYVWDCYHNGKLYSVVGVKMTNPWQGLIHHVFLDFSHNILKTAKEDFKEIVATLKEDGVTQIGGVNTGGEDKMRLWKHYTKAFGFPTPIKTYATVMEI